MLVSIVRLPSEKCTRFSDKRQGQNPASAMSRTCGKCRFSNHLQIVDNSYQRGGPVPRAAGRPTDRRGRVGGGALFRRQGHCRRLACRLWYGLSASPRRGGRYADLGACCCPVARSVGFVWLSALYRNGSVLNARVAPQTTTRSSTNVAS